MDSLRLKKMLAAAGPYLALAALLLVCIFTCESFRDPHNYLIFGRQAAYTGIIALGMTLVIAAGGIDLSVGSLFALSGVGAFLLMPQLPGGEFMRFAGALVLALGIGAAGGAFNGALVSIWRIPPFIVTLGTMSIFHSLALYLADASRVDAANGYFRLITAGSTIAVFAGMAVLFTVLLNLTAFGRRVCAVGSSEKVARYAAVNTGGVKFMTYVLTGLMCGASAFLWAGRVGGISSASGGSGYELDAIAAVIVGGTSMSGGRASMLGTVAGVFIMVLISNALVPWGVSPNLQSMVKGFVIIVAVLFQYKKRS
ncbi:MAG: ABC transporter permease [Victivallaceae bacterium]